MRTLFFVSFLVAVGCGNSNSPSPGGTQGTDSGSPGTDTGSSVDPTVLAMPLTNPIALAADSTHLYFNCDDNEHHGGGGIFKVPIAGGPIVKLADETESTWLAIDDTYVYWLTGDLTSAPVFKRIAKDGTGAKTLSAPVTSVHEGASQGTIAFSVSAGAIIFIGGANSPPLSGVLSFPIDGGGVTALAADDPLSSLSGLQLLGADASGITFTQLDTHDLNKLPVVHMGADGSGKSTVMIRDTAKSYHGDRVLDGVLYWTQDDGSSGTTSEVHKLVGTTDTTLARFSFAGANYVAADSKGVYAAVGQGGKSGIYAVAADGSTSLLHADDVLQPGNEGSPRALILDAKRLYWFSGGFIQDQAEVHALTR
jgi:hypothetical protein